MTVLKVSGLNELPALPLCDDAAYKRCSWYLAISTAPETMSLNEQQCLESCSTLKPEITSHHITSDCYDTACLKEITPILLANNTLLV